MILEAIIGGIVIAAFSCLFGLLVGSKSKVTVQDFNNHKESIHPHPILPCETHSETLRSINTKLDKILDNLIANK
jgi:hypothetical protein